MEPERTIQILSHLGARPRVCRIVRQQPVARIWVEPTAAGHSRPSGQLWAAEYACRLGSECGDVCEPGNRHIRLRHYEHLRKCLSARAHRGRDAERLTGAPAHWEFLVPQHARDVKEAGFSWLDVSSFLYLFQIRIQYHG